MVSQNWKDMLASKPKRHLNIVAPDGTTGRTASSRRYIVARSYNHRDLDGVPGGRRIAILKRSDRIETARIERNKRLFLGTPDAAFIWDTVEGKVIA